MGIAVPNYINQVGSDTSPAARFGMPPELSSRSPLFGYMPLARSIAFVLIRRRDELAVAVDKIESERIA